MRFRSFRIENYKSFRVSPAIAFGSGFNVIVGKNNTGKTAFLEALSLPAASVPHRSPQTVPTPGAAPPPDSVTTLTFEVERTELHQLLAEQITPFFIPTARPNHDQSDAEQILAVLNEPTIAVTCTWRMPAGVFRDAKICCDWEQSGDGALIFTATARPTGTELASVGMRDRIDRQAALSFQLAARFRERIYVFKAERPNIGDGSIATEHRLAANASNLAQVLNRLQTQNPNAFDRLVICLKQVFPDIKAVTVPPIGQSSVRVLVWSIDLATERDDLAVSLSESGTGVDQILAMLYVVLTTRHPQTIVIDEPSSFLHPGAVRTLLEILSTYPQHQYILTTHSPVALSAAKPGALVLFTRNNLETQVRQMNPTEATELASVLAEVGARLSDVFGADRVLWVEGPTEEECFSVIRARCRDALEPAIQTIIVGLRRVGELEGRDAERVVAIYERLVQAPALMPASVGFLFDREGRTSKQREDLARRLGGRVGFLERRMFENYLLQPDAIAAVTSGIQGFREAQVTEDEVESWLRTNMWDGKYWPDGLPEKRTEEIWIRDVHAAKMLATLFKRLSETRVLYEKVKHGVLLTQWICEHRPAAFSELVATIRQALRDQPDEPKI